MDLLERAQKAEPDEVLVQLIPSHFRRRLGALSLGLMSAFIFNQGLSSDSDGASRLLLLAIGVSGFYALYLFWKFTSSGLELTPTELREISGRRVMAVSDMTAIDREAFGFFRPTNGFVILYKGHAPFGMSPGVWWRFGGRIGIGGLLPVGASKITAELLTKMIAARDGIQCQL